jgi:hypothetical protein
MSTSCATCGGAFDPPPGQEAAAFAAEESARCARLREIAAQRAALQAARTQAGIAGVTETVDRVAHLASVDRLELALKAEEERLRGTMVHRPGT